MVLTLTSVTCALCRVYADDRQRTGSAVCIGGPPSPPDVCVRRSCPLGLLRRTAPWPCSSSSQSPGSPGEVQCWDDGSSGGSSARVSYFSARTRPAVPSSYR